MTEPTAPSRHSGGHGVWLGLAGLGRQVSVGLGALVAVKSSAGVRGQCGARMQGSGFSLGPSTLPQPKGMRTAVTQGWGSALQESSKPRAPFQRDPE